MKILMSGKHEIMVDDDFELPEGCWLGVNSKNNYVNVRKYVNGKVKHHLTLHRFVIGAKPGQMVDHIDGNKHNNQLSNLRFCTTSQNSANRKARGYVWHHGNKKWQAKIKVNYKVIRLGYFDTEEEAKAAYNQAKEHYFGEFART